MAASGVAWLISFNIFAVAALIRLLTGFDFLFLHGTQLISLGVFLLPQAVIATTYMKCSRYIAIAREFSEETDQEKIRRGYYVWGYVLLSAILFAFSLVSRMLAPFLVI